MVQRREWMLAFRDRNARGKAELGWLSSRHTFSFGSYFDPVHMGFRALRVINEDRVVPGAGFPPHGHSNMEILSYVLEGALEHKDSLGTGAVIRPGELQRMSAGTGVRHSEYNASPDEPVHFLQIWIEPAETDLPPSYEQSALPEVAPDETRIDLIGSPDGRRGSVTIHQDVLLYRAIIAAGGEVDLPLRPEHHAWVQVVRGAVNLEEGELREGDGLAVSATTALPASSSTGAELLLFDLA
jgi:redox-sensitive bicupin YhaK (pirin superfamily)